MDKGLLIRITYRIDMASEYPPVSNMASWEIPRKITKLTFVYFPASRDYQRVYDHIMPFLIDHMSYMTP